MSRRNDTSDKKFRVVFREARYGVAAPRKDTAKNMDRRFSNRIRPSNDLEGKWLYCFYSYGSDYMIADGNGNFERRVMDWEHTGGQFVSLCDLKRPSHSLQLSTSSSDRTWSPPEQAEHVKFELQFTGGKLKWHDIEASRWKESIYHRKEPGKVAEGGEFSLPLTRKGKAVRWYFLLSSFRLGPAALSAATQKGAADGLSIKHTAPADAATDGDAESRAAARKAQKRAHFVSRDDLKVWRKMVKDGQTYARQARAEAEVIYVVDPYHFAARLAAERVARSLDRMTKTIEEFDSAKGLILKRLDWESINFTPNDVDGDVSDLYSMATLLDQVVPTLTSKTPFPWDAGAARKIKATILKTLKQVAINAEVDSAILVNWLMGPAHRILDIGMSVDSGDKPVFYEDLASDIRAYGLTHWYNVTSLLGQTQCGAHFLANMLRDDLGDWGPGGRVRLPSVGTKTGNTLPDESVTEPRNFNPIGHIIGPYATGDHPVEDSTDHLTFRKARFVVPNLIILSSMCDMHDLGGASGRNGVVQHKRERMMHTFNGLKYLDDELTLTPKKPRASLKTAFAAYKSNLSLGLKVGTAGTGLVTGARDYIENRRLRGVVDWDKLPPPVGQRMEVMLDNNIGGGDPVKTGAAMVTLINTVLAEAGGVGKLLDGKTKPNERLKNGVKLSMSVASTFNEMADVAGFPPMQLADLVTYGDDATAAGRVAMTTRITASVAGMVTSVWTIYTGIGDARDAMSKGDTSVAIGHGLSVFAATMTMVIGSLGFTGALAVTNPVGATLLVIALIGTILATYTKDAWLTTFAEHHHFSTNKTYRNTWFAGNIREDTFAGIKRVGNNWPLAHQRVALLNYLARTRVESKLETRSIDGVLIARKVHLHLQWGLLPEQARFRVRWATEGVGDDREDLEKFFTGKAWEHRVTPGYYGFELDGKPVDDAYFDTIDPNVKRMSYQATLELPYWENKKTDEIPVEEMKWPFIAVEFKHTGGTWYFRHKLRTLGYLPNIDPTHPPETAFKAADLPPRGVAWWPAGA